MFSIIVDGLFSVALHGAALARTDATLEWATLSWVFLRLVKCGCRLTENFLCGLAGRHRSGITLGGTDSSLVGCLFLCCGNLAHELLILAVGRFVRRSWLRLARCVHLDPC